MVSLTKLKTEGYKVKAVHLRRVFNGINYRLLTRYQILDDYGTMDLALLTGGETRVYIKSPDGRESQAIAKCSEKDNFNKKLGLKIALNRAFSSL
jgi:hypothetical protein